MRLGQVPRVITAKFIETSSFSVDGLQGVMAIEQTEPRGSRCDKGP